MKIKVKIIFIYLKTHSTEVETSVSKARVIVLQITQNIIKFSKYFPVTKFYKKA